MHLHRLAPSIAAVALIPAILPAADILKVAGASGRPRETGISVAISASNDVAIQAYSVSLWYPPGTLTVVEATYEGTEVESLVPDYFDWLDDPVQGNVSFAVILETKAPYEGVAILASPDVLRPIGRVVFDVPASAPPGPAALVLADSPDLHPIRNVFTDNGESIVPALEDGIFTVLPPLLRRGRANADARVDISDAIFIFAFLFGRGGAPACTAAANANGDRRLDISDGIWLLQWIFAGGRQPPEPFEACGEETSGLPCAVAPDCS